MTKITSRNYDNFPADNFDIQKSCKLVALEYY